MPFKPSATELPTEAHTSTKSQSQSRSPLDETKHQPPKHLYFAYGSNLSPTQMKSRCTVDPESSSKPLAIATLPHWRWFICEAGYANVLPPAGLRVPSQDSDIAAQVPISGPEDLVYGVLYSMDPGDEGILDTYEGVDVESDESQGEWVGVDVRPREQGDGSYNKWYVEAAVVKWLEGDGRGYEEKVPVLVYVDEQCVRLAGPKVEYIARMNRAIRESTGLGIPLQWVDAVMRRFIPKDRD
ncbi:uncharacterized protein N7511_007260 [Penicillium nucicola]|uniref:uncharacterized protein n=1 Tax=Penicillium nucicola TaxID=1850975 RepID=UPI002545638D|nr:uncharacterized protein N7511_007260 [Penicillium nucicola]KAJ5757078.1 hypothetical protein N7511_007260 [Penicillium nucicola]